MANFLLSGKAVEDLTKIWDFTCDVWSEMQAEKYYYMMTDACQDLADRKIAGKVYPEISPEVLGFKAGRHIVFYRVAKNSVIEVARILHVSMDLKARMVE